MKRFLSVSTIILLLLSMPAFAQSGKKLKYVKNMATCIDYAERNQQTVWPGFHPSTKPSVIVFIDRPLSDAYAINYKPVKLPWHQVTKSPYSIHYLQDSNSLKLVPNDRIKEIEGQLSLIDVQFAEELSLSSVNYNELMSLHAYYYLKFEAPIDQSKIATFEAEKPAFKDVAQLKLMYFEDRVLAFSQQVDATQSEIALRDAVAIHQYRQSLLSSEKRDEEYTMEFFMGVMQYIRLKSENLSEANYTKMSQLFSCRPLSGLRGPEDLSECAWYMMPAYSNVVYAQALDKKLANTNWKQDVIIQFKPISKLVQDYYHMSDETAKTITEQAMKKPDYNYDRISRVIDHIMQYTHEK